MRKFIFIIEIIILTVFASISKAAAIAEIEISGDFETGICASTTGDINLDSAMLILAHYSNDDNLQTVLCDDISSDGYSISSNFSGKSGYVKAFLISKDNMSPLAESVKRTSDFRIFANIADGAVNITNVENSSVNGLRFEFTKPMEETTLIKENFTIKNKSGDKLDYSNYCAGENFFEIDISEFLSDTEYDVQISNNVRSVDGSNAGYNMSFSTDIIINVPKNSNQYFKNVALDKDISCNTALYSESSEDPSILVGGLTKEWAAAVSKPHGDECMFYTIDLGAVYNIAAVRVISRNNTYCDTADMLVSGMDYVSAMPTTNDEFVRLIPEQKLICSLPKSSEKITVDKLLVNAESNTKSRFISFYRNSSESRNWGMVLKELEVYALMPNEQECTKRLSMEPDIDISDDGESETGNLLDGKFSTYWQGSELRAELSYPAVIDHIKLRTDYAIEKINIYSDVDNSGEVLVASEAFPIKNENGEYCFIMPQIPISYVKIKSENNMILSEFDMCGSYFERSVNINNVANNAVVAVSETYSGSAENINDGVISRESCWVASAGSLKGENPHIDFDLNDSYEISKIGLYPHYDYPEAHRNFNIYATNDPEFADENLELIYTAGSDDYFLPRGEFSYISIDNEKKYRYFRIEKIEQFAYDNGCLAFYEVRFLNYETSNAVKVTNTYPEKNETGVTNIDTIYGGFVKIEFSENMKELTPEDVIVTCGDSVLEYTEYCTEGNIFKISMSEFNSYNQYKIIVNTSASDINGNKLYAPYEFSFICGEIINVSKEDGQLIKNAALYKSDFYFNHDINRVNEQTGEISYFSDPLNLLTNGNTQVGTYIYDTYTGNGADKTQFIVIDLGESYEIAGFKLVTRGSDRSADIQNIVAAGLKDTEKPPESEEEFKKLYTDGKIVDLDRVPSGYQNQSIWMYPKTSDSFRYIIFYRNPKEWAMFLNETEIYVKLSTEAVPTEIVVNGDTCTAKTTVKNYSGDDINCKMVIGAFDSDDNMICSYTSDEMTIGNISTISIEKNMNIPIDTASIKAVLIESESNTPICDGCYYLVDLQDE